MKYFIYARKSTDEDDRQVLSIEGQLTELREYALKENLEVIEEFVECKTAKVPGRPIFNRMVEKIEHGGPSGILAWHPFMSIPQFFYIRPVSPLVFLSV